MRGRALSQGELRALFQVCADDPRPQGRRDAALLAVLYGGGLRHSEAVGLDVADYDSTRAAPALMVRGKGNKERRVPVNGGTVAALAAWLEVRGAAPGPLFWPITKGGEVVSGRRPSPTFAWDMLRRRLKEAGLQRACVHDLRRTFVGDLLDAGVDLATVQQMAGHANVQTTVRYDRRGEVAQRAAASRLHVPFVAPGTRVKRRV